MLGWARNAAAWKWVAAETTKRGAGEPVSELAACSVGQGPGTFPQALGSGTDVPCRVR